MLPDITTYFEASVSYSVTSSGSSDNNSLITAVILSCAHCSIEECNIKSSYNYNCILSISLHKQ